LYPLDVPCLELYVPIARIQLFSDEALDVSFCIISSCFLLTVASNQHWLFSDNVYAVSRLLISSFFSLLGYQHFYVLLLMMSVELLL